MALKDGQLRAGGLRDVTTSEPLSTNVAAIGFSDGQSVEGGLTQIGWDANGSTIDNISELGFTGEN